MSYRRIFAIVFIAAAAVPAAAAAEESMLPFDPQRPLHGIVRPDDVGVFFDYLRDAYQAAFEGRDPPRSEALERRAEAIGEELKLRARVGGVLLLNAVEQRVREILQEPPLPRR